MPDPTATSQPATPAQIPLLGDAYPADVPLVSGGLVSGGELVVGLAGVLACPVRKEIQPLLQRGTPV
jgi:hypothetical protein